MHFITKFFLFVLWYKTMLVFWHHFQHELDRVKLGTLCRPSKNLILAWIIHFQPKFILDHRATGTPSCPTLDITTTPPGMSSSLKYFSFFSPSEHDFDLMTQITSFMGLFSMLGYKLAAFHVKLLEELQVLCSLQQTCGVYRFYNTCTDYRSSPAQAALMWWTSIVETPSRMCSFQINGEVSIIIGSTPHAKVLKSCKLSAVQTSACTNRLESDKSISVSDHLPPSGSSNRNQLLPMSLLVLIEYNRQKCEAQVTWPTTRAHLFWRINWSAGVNCWNISDAKGEKIPHCLSLHPFVRIRISISAHTPK